MIEAKGAESESVTVRIELFGSARLAVGQRQVSLGLPRTASVTEIAGALADAHPELVGKVIREDLSGLIESFTLNLNGNEFVDDGPLRLRAGDSLLLFSSQAGG